MEVAWGQRKKQTDQQQEEVSSPPHGTQSYLSGSNLYLLMIPGIMRAIGRSFILGQEFGASANVNDGGRQRRVA